MALPKDSFQTSVQEEFVRNWRGFVDNIAASMEILEKGIDEAAQMRDVCTDEWCVATEHVIDELSNSLFSISEPRWSTKEDSRKIKELRRRMHDLYAKYKATAAR